MSLRKLGLLTMAAVIAAFAAGSEARMSNSPGRLLRAKIFRSKSAIAPAVALPVQSKNVKDLGTGKLLVASRNLGDPNFAKTVVLLLDYSAEHVIGLTLNRRTAVPLSRVLQDKAAKDRSDPVYLGGPVGTPALFALLRSSAKVEGGKHIFAGVYLITTKSLFEQTISTRTAPSNFHVYLGYAGWTMDQLRKEVELGSWFIFPPDVKTVFDPDPDSLWPRMIARTELKLAGNEPDLREGLAATAWRSRRQVLSQTRPSSAHIPARDGFRRVSRGLQHVTLTGDGGCATRPRRVRLP